MSLIGTSGKSYGLSVKNNTQTSFSKPSVFDSDSASDVEDKPNIRSLQAKHATKAAKQLQQVLETQPDIYQYDEVYDEMEESRIRRQKNVQARAKQSKYVSLIKDMSSEREREWERRQERKYQTEREKEGDLYKDKDAYTTPGYKKYLEERRADDERELEREEQEKLLDVTKQKSMSLFYSNLLTGNVAMGADQDQQTLKLEECKQDENLKVETITDSAHKDGTNSDAEENRVTENTNKTEDFDKEFVFVEKKVDIFAKRTTEEMRLAALERYLERKIKRLHYLQATST